MRVPFCTYSALGKIECVSPSMGMSNRCGEKSYEAGQFLSNHFEWRHNYIIDITTQNISRRHTLEPMTHLFRFGFEVTWLFLPGSPLSSFGFAAGEERGGGVVVARYRRDGSSQGGKLSGSQAKVSQWYVFLGWLPPSVAYFECLT